MKQLAPGRGPKEGGGGKGRTQDSQLYVETDSVFTVDMLVYSEFDTIVVDEVKEEGMCMLRQILGWISIIQGFHSEGFLRVQFKK